jgi:pimeloyl-ACP methyl ester carboxylesterase
VRALAVLLLLPACWVPPDWSAPALVQPARRPSVARAGEPFTAFGLAGWVARGQGAHRGLIVYLHGVGDNKDSAVGIAARLNLRGWDMAAYDARAHGSSFGTYCTYGYYERYDIDKILTQLKQMGIDTSRVVLFGSSMGAAVALQAAPHLPSLIGVVAQSPFAELWSAVHGLKPGYMSEASFVAGVRRAEQLARFSVDDVAPVRAARSIAAPVLLVHGTADAKLPPAHARQIRDAAPRAQLVLVDGAGHDDVLARPESWRAIDRFLDEL